VLSRIKVVLQMIIITKICPLNTFLEPHVIRIMTIKNESQTSIGNANTFEFLNIFK